MGMKKGISEARLKLIYQRQDKPRWGKHYVPSILATPQEAPSISRAATLTPSKVGGRDFSALSTPEQAFSLLALYHPWVKDIHEQKMLSPEPRPHPLYGYPGVAGVELPPIRGIVDVAERLGCVGMLPRVRVQGPAGGGKGFLVPFPYIGDLLLYVQKPKTDRAYCVNWSIKGKAGDFKRPISPNSRGRGREKKVQAVLTRHEIEKIYYQDVQIRTLHLSGDNFDPDLFANLRQLFLDHRRHVSISGELQEEIVSRFQTAIEASVPPMDVIARLIGAGRLTAEECRTCLYQAIWNRWLRVDLFNPIVLDRPLRPEERDVIRVYSDWFEE
jgi:hypothetical protein